MKITINNGELSVPKDFAFPIKATHPFFSKEGVASAPLELPMDRNNRDLLKRPADIARAERFTRQFPAMLSSGPFTKKCSLIIDSVSDESCSACLALQESEVYAKIKDRTLQDLLSGETVSGGYSEVNIPWGLYSHGVMDYAGCTFMQVACEGNTEGEYFILNEIKDNDGGFVDEERTITIGTDQVKVPAGYGLALFMHVGYALDLLFRVCGYTVRRNVFRDDEDLKTLVFLNNAADNLTKQYGPAGHPWKVNVPDILPTVTMGELIGWLHDKFGVLVIRNEFGIDILRFSDLVAAPADLELDGYISARNAVQYTEQKGLSISCDTGNDRSKPAAADLQALRKKFQSATEVRRIEDIADGAIGMYKVLNEGAYYYSDLIGKTFIGSDAFPYTRHIAPNDEKLDADDLFVPTVRVGRFSLPFVGKRKHNYIGQEETDGEQQIMICHCYPSSAQFVHPGRPCGSSYSYEINGMPVAKSDGTPFQQLTPEGLRNNFLIYEKMLANGAPSVKVEAVMPLDVILGTDWLTPKLLDGAKVIMQEMNYMISSDWETPVTMTLAVIPEYVDSVVIPDVEFNVDYHWQYVNEYKLDPGEQETGINDGLTDYTIEDAPKDAPFRVGDLAKLRERWTFVWGPWYWIGGRKTRDTYKKYYYEYFIGTK